MGRRQINPGPIKTGPTAQNSRDYVPGISDWICVNPVPNGVMPVNVSTISDDLANGVEGVWYYYDPHTVADISGHSSNWVSVGPNGVEFYVDLDKSSSMRAEENHALSCRIATMFMKPDGTGQFTADEIQGIDFRIEAGENIPHADNEQFGIGIGLAKAEICSTDSTNSNAERKFGLCACYGDTAVAGGAVGNELGYQMYTASNNQGDNGGPHTAVTASFEFSRKDDDEVGSGYATGHGIDSDGEYNTVKKNMNNTLFWGINDKIYLWIQPWSYKTVSATGSANIKRTGAFKLWYRLRYSLHGRTPDWIEGRVNNHSGVVSDRY